MRRETSRVSFLMCPLCVRGLLSVLTTENVVRDASDHDHELLRVHGGARRGLLPTSHPLLDRAQHLAFHQEVDGFEQERQKWS